MLCNLYRVSIKRVSCARLLRPQSRRWSSSSSVPKGTRRQRQQKQRQEFQEQNIPKWPAVASLVMIPVMFGAWQVSEYVLGNRQVGMNESLRRQFQEEVHEKEWLDNIPPMFYCVIRKNTGFTHCLTGVQIGDVVEVLKEGVGSKKEYNLCRLPANPGDDLSVDTYGWFPYRWLQKLEDYESIVQQHQAENEKR